jgi:hypothetical protein
MVSSPSVEKPRASASSSWDALADIEVFITAAEADLVALERERTGVRRRGRKPDPVLRRRLLGVTWMLTFGGMQWRLAGLLSGIPFTTLHSAFARWTRLWRRLGQRLALDWRIACGDEALPSALVVDSNARLQPASARGIDGGKNIKGIKLHVVCDKHGSLIDLEVTPANHDDRASALPMLPRLAELGFQGTCSQTTVTRANPSPRQGVLTIWRFRSRPEEHPTASSSPVAFAGWSSAYSLGFHAIAGSILCSPRSLCLPRLDRHHLHPGAPPPPKPRR